MQKVKDVVEAFRTELSSSYERGELEQIIFLAFEHVLGFSKTDLVTKREDVVSDDKASALSKIIDRLSTQEPIQYIIGSTEFYGLPIKVNKSVLIPRQETEELVDLIIKEAHALTPSISEGEQNRALNILDICTGSGCIAVVLKRHIPQSNVFAIDISNEALAVAKENAEMNQAPVTFINDDIFNLKSEIFNLKSDFDILVSNPPYVMKSEMKDMTARELNYEPHLAFFTWNDDPLIFYRQIAEIASKRLKQGGKLYFEINELMGGEVVKLLENKGFKNVVLKKDLNGKDRMISCQRG